MAKAEPVVGLSPAAATRVNLPLVFGARVRELWSWAEHVRFPERVQELHDMRIAAKRLRYCLEFFTPCFGKGFKDSLNKFKKLQDFLGEIHDCDVWVDYLSAELREALKIMRRSAGRLAGVGGHEQERIDQIGALRGELAGGAAAGLLMLMDDVVQRRKGLYGEFVTYWEGLENEGFRDELTALVADASRSEEAELVRVNLS